MKREVLKPLLYQLNVVKLLSLEATKKSIKVIMTHSDAMELGYKLGFGTPQLKATFNNQHIATAHHKVMKTAQQAIE